MIASLSAQEAPLSHRDMLRDRIAASVATKQRLLDDDAAICTLAAVAEVMIRCARQGGTIFFFGNGGSSTDAQHLAAELVGRFAFDRPPLAAICLSDSSAAVTAIANDYGYGEVFARQLTGLARPGDVAVGLSTSGDSSNVVTAMARIRDSGVTRVGLTGERGGALTEVVDLLFRAPSGNTARVQECHLLAGHTLCEIVEAALFSPPGGG